MTVFARVAALLICCVPAVLSASTHPVSYWRSIAQQKYTVPEGASASELADELSGMLASPDPELRDDLAYSILAHWIPRGVLPNETLVSLTDRWESNLKKSIGEKDTNTVLLRSFSALCLASMARRENRSPFMGEPRYHKLFSIALDYLIDEKDLRGWEPKVGWIHASAHTSDLLEALASNPHASKEELSRVLSAIAKRIAAAPHVYTQGEQDRMAAALAAVLQRPDFEASLFNPWLTAIDASDQQVWKKPLTEESLAAYQNHTYLLQALTVRLMIEPAPSTAGFRDKIVAVLKSR